MVGREGRRASDCLRPALSTMACATPGFLRMCWPRPLFILKTLLVSFLEEAAPEEVEYGLELEAWPPFLVGALPIVVA